MTPGPHGVFIRGDVEGENTVQEFIDRVEAVYARDGAAFMWHWQGEKGSFRGFYFCASRL